MQLDAVVFASNARAPTDTFCVPVVFAARAFLPIAVLLSAVFASNALLPTAVL